MIAECEKKIVESGENENGRWVKFEDGTMIVAQRFTRTYETKNPYGAGFFGYVDVFPDFPQTFIETPAISVTFEDNDAMSIVPYNSTKNNASSSNAYIYSLVSLEYAKTVNVNVIAIGKWK